MLVLFNGYIVFSFTTGHVTTQKRRHQLLIKEDNPEYQYWLYFIPEFQ